MSNEIVVDLQTWKDLYSSPGFHKFQEYVDARKKSLYQKIENIRRENSPSADTGIIIQSILARIDELDSFTRSTEFKQREWKKLKDKGDITL